MFKFIRHAQNKQQTEIINNPIHNNINKLILKLYNEPKTKDMVLLLCYFIGFMFY